LECFGSGGFGQVYKVKDNDSSKYYALKLQVNKPKLGVG
jgi:serine/threonine protein kinase